MWVNASLPDILTSLFRTCSACTDTPHSHVTAQLQLLFDRVFSKGCDQQIEIKQVAELVKNASILPQINHKTKSCVEMDRLDLRAVN